MPHRNYRMTEVEAAILDHMVLVASPDIDGLLAALTPRFRSVDIKISLLNLVNRQVLDLTDSWQPCMPGMQLKRAASPLQDHDEHANSEVVRELKRKRMNRERPRPNFQIETYEPND